MISVKRLLSKDCWTGEELGRLALANIVTTYVQNAEGKPVKPLISQEDFSIMLNTIVNNSKQVEVYQGYIAINNWLSSRYTMAQAHMQQAQLQYRTLSQYVNTALLTEDIYDYIEQLPKIVTQKEYDDTIQRNKDNHFTTETGESCSYELFSIVKMAIDYYLELLKLHPRKANPLKAIRKLYISQPIKSSLIRDKYNYILGRGYYVTEDGIRSDEVSKEEWEALLNRQNPVRKYHKHPEDMTEEEKEEALRLMYNEELARHKAIYDKLTDEEYIKMLEEKNREDGLPQIPDVHFKFYDEVPEINKWDFIEQNLITDFYFCARKKEIYNRDKHFIPYMTDFYSEFKELVVAMLEDMEKKYFPNKHFSKMSLEELLNIEIATKELYDLNCYGEQELVNNIVKDIQGYRAKFNGIAILQPNSEEFITNKARVDSNGYYVEPKVPNSLFCFSLMAFFPEAKEYEVNLEIVERARKDLLTSYCYIKGYNLALDLIAKKFKIPEIEYFQMDLESIECKIKAVNDVVPSIYSRIDMNAAQDGELKRRKLEVLHKYFSELKYQDLEIPKENIEKVQELFKGFLAFKDNNSIVIDKLLCFFELEGV